MISLIKKLLLKVVDDMDAGNSNITEEEGQEIIETIQRLSRRDEGISKYDACRYLNVSRATFDNKVKEGIIPEGRHIAGFKEKRWFKKDLDSLINNKRNDNTKKFNHPNIRLQINSNYI